MRVKQIRIHNILGIDDLDIRPGAVTKITGKNGTGKTSILEALKSLIDGGHDASLIRKGADSGEVVIVLDDGSEFRRSVTDKGAYLSGKDADGKPIKKAKQVIESLLDALSANPVAFLTAPAAKRAAWLLEAMPINVTDEALSTAAGRRVTGDGLNGLEAIERTRRMLYEERTAVNRAEKEKRATAEQLRASLPAVTPADLPATAADAHDRLRAIDAELATAKHEAREAADEEIKRVTDESAKDIAAIQAEIHKLSLQAAARERERDAEIARIQSVARGLLEQTLAEKQAERTVAAAEVARLEQLADEHARAENTRGIIDQMTAEADQRKRESEELSAGLERIQALRNKLLENLPIKGLEIRDGEIFVDGIAFDRLNTAKRVQIALKVAKLRAGECPLVLVDNLECLDSQTFAAFESAAAKLGMQFVVTRVSDEPKLQVETKGGGSGT